MTATSIEWTSSTWNPVTGCDPVSAGCDRCYAAGIAHRFAGTSAFPAGFAVTLRPERLDAPLRWRAPARVFVNSMSDLFHSGVSDTFIARVWAVMAACPQHAFQVLTKRPGRMRSLLTSRRWPGLVLDAVRALPDIVDGPRLPTYAAARAWAESPELAGQLPPPLPNAWCGVSTEDQRWADLRIPALLGTPARVRFVSAEPLLAPIHLAPDWAGLDWVIVGGESGPGARPMDPTWAGALVARCRELGIAPFVKQLGSAHGPHKGADMTRWPAPLRVREFPTTTTTTDTAGGAR